MNFFVHQLKKIPLSVTLIREFAFASCEHLERIEFAENSKLQTIEEDAFLNRRKYIFLFIN